LVEIRLDLTPLSDQEIEKIFSQSVKLVATCRPGKLSEDKRKALLKKSIESGADYADIELEATDSYKKELIDAAKKNSCKVIISYHNNEKTPSRGELDQVVGWCFDSGADIAKIACLVSTPAESARILSLYDNDRPVIAIGMGEAGRFTRVAAPFLGAPFTYASLSSGKETAEGQIDKKTLEDLLERLKGV